MLKPFHIRDLRVSDPEPPTSPPNPALVRISTTDYDAIATNHPRARLTYVDQDDDGDETITVGSALELSQRLEEPLDMSTQLESIQLQSDVTPTHIFDVRRSNSVTELWQRYRVDHAEQDSAGSQDYRKPSVTDSADQPEPSASTGSFLPPLPNEPRPLMEAFEAELAEMLNSTDTKEKQPKRSTSPPVVEPSTSSSSTRTPHPIEIVAAQVAHHLANGAHMVQSEWRARVPELQRQLRNSQRQLEAAHMSLPQHLETSLRALLATLEAQLRTAFNNIPEGGRRMAQDVFETGRPVAENAADGLRMMATEFNEVGRTLFSAFESEFGRAAPTASSNGEPAAPMPPAAPVPTHPQDSTRPSNEKASSSGEPQSALNNPLNMHQETSSHFPTPPYAGHVPPHPNQWVPPPTISNNNPWNPFQRYPPPPPPYPSNPPTQQPPVWPQPRATPWPHWRPAPTPAVRQDPSSTQARVANPSNPRTVDSAPKSLFVGNVGFNVREQTLRDVFAANGFIVEVDLPTDATSEIHAGFGYVHFPSEHLASAAMQQLQGTLIDGLSINLEHMHHPSIEKVRTVQDTSAHDNEVRGAQLPPSDPSSAKRIYSDPKRWNFTKADQDKLFEFALREAKDDARSEYSALLDSPSDDPAFSARYPSLLPGTISQRQGTPSNSHSGAEMSRFPPVSQQDARLLAGNTAAGPNQTLYAGSLKRRSTEYQSHRAEHGHSENEVPPNTLYHSASMHDLGQGVRDVAATEATADPQPVADNVPAEEISPDLTSATGDVNGFETGYADIEQCVSALIDMGYGTEQEGGRARMAIYAAAAEGSLMDAIDMIEEERRAYECRASY
ncbi:hypothetical protein N7452_005135 [Penicillium brevicompactum]|uniref:RRM domain-containing protein n=1 Tax=Penicillium brevicompactum TaxID=5074 RepID=A0A9W9UEV2_PENBR|nr:hypothetical protein N7452_005135 [Penicillium brevicompactum]